MPASSGRRRNEITPATASTEQATSPTNNGRAVPSWENPIACTVSHRLTICDA